MGRKTHPKDTAYKVAIARKAVAKVVNDSKLDADLEDFDIRNQRQFGSTKVNQFAALANYQF